MEGLISRIILFLLFIMSFGFTSYGQDLFFLGENSYKATEAVTLSTNATSILKYDLNVSFARDGKKPMIAVSARAGGNVKFTGKLIIYLDNAKVVVLSEGQTDYVDDIAYAVYYLSKNDLKLIKNINIDTIRYTLEGNEETLNEFFGGNTSASNKGEDRFDFPALASNFF